MSEGYTNESMQDIYIFETVQLLEQLEQLVLGSEKTRCFTKAAIDEIFRIMHTIKGSSAMMMFDGISLLAHWVEDLFSFLREDPSCDIDCPALSDLVLEGIDFTKVEIAKIKNGDEPDGDASEIIKEIGAFLNSIRGGDPDSPGMGRAGDSKDASQKYYISPKGDRDGTYENAFEAILYFKQGCEMENIRAFSVVHKLKENAGILSHIPSDVIDNDESAKVIRDKGFTIFFQTDQSYDEVYEFLMQTVFLEELSLTALDATDLSQMLAERGRESTKTPGLRKVEDRVDISHSTSHQSIISVAVEKLDMLMDFVGEMVIAEAMVIQNPDLKGLELDNFQKAARQLQKITGEIQDMVMSIRMVPVSMTFHKMHRIVRDMSKRLGKEIDLVLVGEETEVDKNIIENISDPLMHLIRNSIDHGIEDGQMRQEKGKAPVGTITLEAKNAGRDVLIEVRDDGRGLDRDKILQKARDKALLVKSEDEMSEREIYNLILMPGFSTNEDVSEYSGRGVGMDVVTQNIEALGGVTYIDSVKDRGTTITLKIPLTLAIIEGMNVKVGNSRYTIPITSIKESFRPLERDIITDTDGEKMIMVRGECLPILRLYQRFGVMTEITDLTEGILIIVEAEDRDYCIFADELLGQQEVVVKTLPEYIINSHEIKGLSGCTLLGDGSISLILDVVELTL